jgi:hypothetical protein
VRLESVYQTADRRKGRSPVPAEFPLDVPTTCRVPLSPDDRAGRLAEIRAVLADAAPTFRARIAAGESEARP